MTDFTEEQIKSIREEERFKTNVLAKLDQIMSDILSIKNDLNKKLDKNEFTNSWEPRLMKLESDQEVLHNRLDNLEKFQSRLIGIGIGSGAVGSVVGSGATILITWLLNKY